jgi:DNA-binding NtrC family response regulator
MNVVVVEDAPEIAQLLGMMLHVNSEISVTIVTEDFETCVERIDWAEVDAILCDRWLGKYDGANILEWVEKNYPDIKRVVLTADVGVSEKEVHAHRVLIKMASQDLILKALETDYDPD